MTDNTVQGTTLCTNSCNYGFNIIYLLMLSHVTNRYTLTSHFRKKRDLLNSTIRLNVEGCQHEDVMPTTDETTTLLNIDNDASINLGLGSSPRYDMDYLQLM